MKAAVTYERARPMVLDEVELPELRAGEARVRIGASGVCHSDYHHWSREMGIPLPVVLGHEAAGVVAAVGPDVTRVAPGDHVVIAFGWKCGACFYCLRGMPQLCTPADTTPRTMRRGDRQIYQAWGVSSFAEETVVSVNNLVVIPREIPMPSAALIACGVTTGLGAVFNTARVEPGAHVVVIGTGGVGLNVVQGARIAGAARIIAVDVHNAKLELAASFGATHLVNGSREDVTARVRELTGGYGADYAFEVIGLPKTIEQAYESLRKGGTAVVVGVASPDAALTIHPLFMMRTERVLKGCAYGSSRPQVDFPRVVELYQAGRLKLDELVSRRFALDEVNEAFAAMHRGEVARGVIVS